MFNDKTKKSSPKSSIDEAKVKAEAAAYVTKGKFKKALPLYLELSQLHPKDLRLKTKIGDLLHKIGKVDDAITVYRHVAARYAADGMLIQAIAVNKLVLQLAPQDTGIQKELAALYGRKQTDERGATLGRVQTVVQPIKIREVSVSGKEPRNELRPNTPRAAPVPAQRAAGDSVEIVVEREIDEEIVDGEPITEEMPAQEIDGRLIDFAQAVDLGSISEVALPPTPLFSNLDEATFDQVVSLLRRSELSPGQVVCEEGDAGDSIFIISDGQLTVSSRDSAGKNVDLATLFEGDFFGEFGYFADRKRHATVRARTEAVVLELVRADVDRLIKDLPRMREILQEFYQRRLLDTLLAKSRIFRPLSKEARELLAKRFSPEAHASGAVLMREGDDGDSLYLIQSGRLEVSTEKDGKRVVLATLREGDFCGEFSVFTGTKRTATIIAVSPVELLKLSKDRAREVLGMNDEIPRILKQIYDERVAGTIRTLTGVSITAPDGGKTREGMV